MEEGRNVEKQLQDESVWVPKTPAKSAPARLKLEDNPSFCRKYILANQDQGLNQSDKEVKVYTRRKNKDVTKERDDLKSLREASENGNGNIIVYQRRQKISVNKELSHELVSYNLRNKQVPKVFIDLETKRKWKKLIYGVVDGVIDWEEHTKFLHDQLCNFVALMNKIQGGRLFSEWKGSVVDSVVGVFLSQNVSDHLSSFAFMTLASRFPINGDDCVYSCPSETFPFVECSRKKKTKGKKNNNNKGGTKKQALQIDWDELHKKYGAGEEKEISGKYSDSVDWEAVRQAPPKKVADAIKMRGQQDVIGGKIQEFLNRLVRDHGDINLEWLRRVPPDLVKKYLLSFEGLGMKSVECIRLLCLHQPAFPVDVNVARVAARLGWYPLQQLPHGLEFELLNEYSSQDRNGIQAYLWPRLCSLDQNFLYELHYQTITFGKVFCSKRNPRCGICPMRNACQYYQRKVTRSKLSLTAKNEESTSRDIEDWPSQTEDGDYMTGRLRTVHQVYELPDSHPILAALEKREGDDPSPYLILIWASDDDAGQCKLFRRKCRSRKSGLGDVAVSGSLDVIADQSSETVPGTLLIPCRTANRGRFPLNGTFFQVNEVFADYESAAQPIQFPRESLLNLTSRFLYCGSTVSAICTEFPVDEIQQCFSKGFICLWAFDAKTKEPVDLPKKFTEKLHRITTPKGRKGRCKRKYSQE